MWLCVFRIYNWVTRRGDDFRSVEFLDLFGEGFFLIIKTASFGVVKSFLSCHPSINFFEFSLHLLLIGPFDVLFLIPLPGNGSMAFVCRCLIGVPVNGDFALHVVVSCMGEGVRNSMYILRR